MNLTPTQMRYVTAIEDYWREYGHGPTHKELAAEVGISLSATTNMVERLRAMKVLLPSRFEARALRTTRMRVQINIGAWPDEPDWRYHDSETPWKCFVGGSK